MKCNKTIIFFLITILLNSCGGENNSNNNDNDGGQDVENEDTTPECTSNDGCTEPLKSRCENNKCTGCIEDYDCEHLQPTVLCEDYKCIECRTNIDCKDISKSKCDLGECSGCGSDEDCTQFEASPHCLDIGKICVGCRDNNDCSDENPLCNPSTHQCVECIDGADCELNRPERPICETEVNSCVECITNEQCPTIEEAFCQYNYCVGCEKNEDCSRFIDTPYCNPEDKTCVNCIDNNQCTEIRPLCNQEGHRCVECVYDTDCTGCSGVDCEGMNICNTGHECVSGCVECNTDTECAELGTEFYCIADDGYGNTMPHCMRSAESVSNICPRPWQLATKPRDGGSSTDLIDVCIPPSTTTCLGISEIGVTCESGEGLYCGDNGIDDDATCRSGEYCSYPCNGDSNLCPDGYTCNTYCVKN